MPFDPLDPSSGKQAPAGGGSERRRDPRYPLVAEARIADIGSSTEIKLRTSDLSITGCYLDTVSPLPNGIDIVVKISRDDGLFETVRKVVYVHPGMEWGCVSMIPNPHSKPFLSDGSQKSPAPKTEAFRAGACVRKSSPENSVCRGTYGWILAKKNSSPCSSASSPSNSVSKLDPF
jgi:hypothetical protein